MRFVTLQRARHRRSPVRQVLLTGSVNINKTSSPSVPTPTAARLGAMQMQVLRKQPVKPLCRGRLRSLPVCGQVSTVWPSLASGCLHSMNDKGREVRATLSGIDKNWDQSTVGNI